MRGNIVYRPELDGLRALSVLAVVGLHSQVEWMRGGAIGVDVFFVLSGYLITRVLAENQPSMMSFYTRRAQRLIPALAFMLAAYLLIMPVIRPGLPHLRDAALAFFYLSDYSYAFWKAPHYLAHTWSLSVEEHFYLLWPLIFLRWQPSVKALLFAYLAATLWRYVQTEWHPAYFRFDTRMSGLILGCLLAKVRRIDFHAWPGLLVLAVIVYAISYPPDMHLFKEYRTFAELSAGLAIMGRQPQWLSSAPLVMVGKLSYGIYLWHYPITLLLRENNFDQHANLAITVAASVTMAAVSYTTVEAYWRSSPRRRERLAEAG
jgi:peptidoglycan/LPS O-acetylase OafA/YrhL